LTTAVHTQSVKERIIGVAVELFAKKGMDGTSVRSISDGAAVGVNMISHYFGGKEGLIREVLAIYNVAIFDTPLRIISEPAKDKEEFHFKLDLFLRETLEALIRHKSIVMIIFNFPYQKSAVYFKEVSEANVNYQNRFVEFLEAGKPLGAIRQGVDTWSISSFLFDRFTTQVRYADFIQQYFGQKNIMDDTYKHKWVRANLEVFLNGVAAQ